MNKKEFVKALSSNMQVTDKLADQFVDAFVATVTDALNAGEKIAIVGFGTFEVKDKPEREGFNPLTNEKITIKASKVPAFKAGKTFKESIK